MSVISISLKLILITLLGYAARKTGVVTSDSIRSITRLSIDVIIPCYIFNAVSSIGSLQQMIDENGKALLTAAVYMAFTFMIGSAGYAALKGSLGRLFRFGTMFSNTLIFGIPIAESYWGSRGMLYLMTMYIPIRFGYYGLAELLMSERGSAGFHWQNAVKVLVSPAVLCYIAALVLLGFQISLPAPLKDTLAMAGACCTPIGLMIVGMIVADFSITEVFSKDILLLTGYKIFLLPLLTLLFCALTGIHGMPGRICVLVSAVPIGPLTATFSMLYEKDPKAHAESAGWTLLSTVCSIFSIPCWLMIMEKISLI